MQWSYSEWLINFAEAFANGFVLENEPIFEGIRGLEQREFGRFGGLIHVADSKIDSYAPRH